MIKFNSNGKLLLTAEYVVLDGAKALAIPTKYGQNLIIKPTETPTINWCSFDEQKNIWFNGNFEINNNTLKPLQQNAVSDRIVQIFEAINKLNPTFLNIKSGYDIETHLEFPKNWGLGTSSTLINNLSKWTNINPYNLLKLTFGGSGYDIACAENSTPITYKINTESEFPLVEPVCFNPIFKEHLYFVYLNKKQNSRDGIAHYKAQNKSNLKTIILEINRITHEMLHCDNLKAFENLIDAHEHIIAKITNQIPAKDLYFNDFNGSIKSLGAWGGDFILATSVTNPESYFKSKGLTTVIPYSKMIL
ncbi:GHMP kinase [Seonamhaeicola algicola]|uniref:GHMP kinase n=1 Tax=Seonamhaeicola algicola TaxID=1719036 RepID=A0A5C7AL26_9FLAO|nr:GYDIA family GHMP kinase [Seonamhaeicola algicola]TXE07275.1 GHMP kinase [Seonamhaeicola algicola]